MSYAIGSNHSSHTTSIDHTEQKPAVAHRDTAAASKVTKASSDAATLSGTGNLLANAVSAPGNDDVRTEKVASIRAAIHNGSYNVPAADVADSLIRTLQR